MKPWIAWLLLGVALAAGQEPNINARYTVEAVEVAGIDEAKLSRSLAEDLHKLEGEKFDQEAVDKLARRLRREAPSHSVSTKLRRGTKPEHIKVIFELERQRRERFDVNSPKIVYHSKQAWTGSLDASFGVKTSRFTFGIVSDADELLERYAGIRARYENRKVVSDAVRLRFDFESYHQIWNRATLEAWGHPEAPGIYRTRQNFQPVLVLNPFKPLTVSGGVSFQRFQVQYPLAHTEAANAVIASVRFDEEYEDFALNRHRIQAGYSVRVATPRTLDSDSSYTRHFFDARYTLQHRRSTLVLSGLGGRIRGQAPLFERFSLGNFSTLRGWNKFDVAPVGGDRAAHGTLEYHYRSFQMFYDTGTVWNRGESYEVKHSIGLGFRGEPMGGFSFFVAFPVKSGRAAPIFGMGFTF